MNEYESELWILDRFLELREYIQNLEAENERYRGVIKLLEKDVAEAKVEAYKEFAERLLVQDKHSTMDNRIITADRVKRTLTELTERKEDEGK